VHDIFAFVIKFLKGDWYPKHGTLGVFEAINTSRKTLGINLIELLQKYNLKKNIVAYVKNEGVS